MLKPNQLLAWIWQPTATDRRLGFVPVTRAEFQMMQSQGRAQDPRVGALHLKPITNENFVPAAAAAPETEQSQAAPSPVPRATTRRRVSSPAGEA